MNLNMTTIKKGSKGNDVIILQKFLGITPDGDFGPKTEAAVKEWQSKNGLTPDGIVGPKSWAKINATKPITNTAQTSAPKPTTSTDDINIIKMPLSVHVSKLVNRPIKYIAIHYTAGGSSKPGSAQAIKHVFEKRKASADFGVDDRDIVQFNPDLKNYYCWSVGDKKNPYSSGGSLYGKATNRNTISIEMCSNLKKGASGSAANHDGWYLTEETINNTIKLTKYLMKKFNIPKSNVVRHYDVSGKLCPGVIGWNNEKIYTSTGVATKESNNSNIWEQFKLKL